MNRRQRRANRHHISTQRIRQLERKVEATGLPGTITGLTDACRDCTADGAFTLLPGGYVIGHVFHDEHCPAAAGVTTWQPVPDNATSDPT